MEIEGVGRVMRKMRPKMGRGTNPVRASRSKKEAASEPRAVALAYLEAVSQKQFDKLAELLHPDVEFKGPGGSLHNAQDFISALRRLEPILLRNEIKRVFVEGDEAFVRYDFVTDTSVGAVPTVELLKIEDGRVRSIWLLFDRQPWPAVLEEAARRAKR